MVEAGRKAIPKEGYFELERGRYGPIFPRTPACYGFSIIAKVKEGREEAIRAHGKKIEESDRGQPGAPRAVATALPPLAALRYRARPELPVPRHLRHRLRQVHRGRRRLFGATGIKTVFTNLEGFPEDWKENPDAFVKFVREHQCPSFLEYGEYPYVTADEIKKALRLKAAFSDMLDQMQ